jgi:hypothetical protein
MNFVKPASAAWVGAESSNVATRTTKASARFTTALASYFTATMKIRGNRKITLPSACGG